MSTAIQPGIHIDASDYNAGRTNQLADFTAMQDLGLIFAIAKAYEAGWPSAPTGQPDGTDEHWPEHKAFLKTMRGRGLVIGAMCRLQKDGAEDDQADTFLGLISNNHNPTGWMCVVHADGNHGLSNPSPDFNAVSKFAKEFWKQAPGHPLFLFTSKAAWQSAGGGDAYNLGLRLFNDVDSVDNAIGGGALGTINIRCFDNLSTYLSWGFTTKTPACGAFGGYLGKQASAMLYTGKFKFGNSVHDGDAFNGTSTQLLATTVSDVPTITWAPGEMELTYTVSVPDAFGKAGDNTTKVQFSAATPSVGMTWKAWKPDAFAGVIAQGSAVLSDDQPAALVTDA